jgi:protein-disulfide isomerase
LTEEPRRGAAAASADWKRIFLAALIGALLGAGLVLAAMQAGLGGDRSRLEGIVHDYILDNPEILPEAMERLQERQAGQAIETNRAAYETPFGSAWAGAEDADVVLVEFFDYACGFCRRANPDVERLLKEDGRLKVVWRELPVLGPASEAAAVASLAAAEQGRFRQFHKTLFDLGRPSPQTIARAQQAVGVTAAEGVPAPYRAELEKNYELARAIQASGTPTFVAGNRILQGAVGYEALKTAIAEARANRS